jgi:formylmethanofuran dehydrogenase subunit D
MADITLDGKPEKNLKLKAGDPMKLMQCVLKDQRIKEGKARMHIAYNIARAYIEMAQEKDISLTYREGNHMRVLRMDGDNIVLEDQDDATHHG